MIRTSRLGIAVATALALAAAPAFAKTNTFNTHLSGENEVPARSTHATGQATFTVSTDQTTMDFRINVSNIENVVAVKLAQGAPGTIGPDVAVLYGPVTPGGGKASGVLTTGTLQAASLMGPLAGQTIASLISEIQAGRIYVNVVTDDGVGAPDEKPGDFSSGEIRGQLQ